MKMRVFLLFLIMIFSSACGPGPIDPNHELLDKETINCPAGFYSSRVPWEGGVSRVCKIMDGPFVAVEDGYVHIRSEHKMGKSIGITRVYGKDGSLVRTIESDQDGKTIEAIAYDKDGNATILDLSEYHWL